MKKCAFWDESLICHITGEYKPCCKDCNFYKDKETADKKRKESAMRNQSLSFFDRKYLYEKYYMLLTDIEKEKFYVSLWWNYK